jgi:V-type H+-transporting ATPase subunit a
MKKSIIVGVIQMTVGLFLHLLNAIEFHKPLDIIFDFIPRFIFLEAIFGYLCFLIFYKWGVDWSGQDAWNKDHPNATLPGSQGAPVILNELIFMFLPGGKTDSLYPGQSKVQIGLVVLAGISLPWMLMKPCIEYCQHNSECCQHPFCGGSVHEGPVQHKGDTVTVVELNNESEKEDPVESSASLEEDDNKVPEVAVPKNKPEDFHEEEFQFSESCIHCLLETIEFVLGSVSHTASYLRLWALSLAHSELATVFWDKVMFLVFEVTFSSHWIAAGFIGFCGFSAWFAITLCVMMFMELLSALLHALRLHWVEFQSKFYRGDGTPFRPFSFRKIHHNKNVMLLAYKSH